MTWGKRLNGVYGESHSIVETEVFQWTKRTVLVLC